MCLKRVEEEKYDLDTIQKWIDDCCEVGEEFYEKGAVLTESYNNYLREEEKSRLSVQKATVTKNLKSKGFVLKRPNEGKGSNRGRVTIIQGLRIRSECESESGNVVNMDERKK